MKRPVRLTTLCAALTIAAISSLCLTANCQGEEVLFEDDFKTQDPAWGQLAKIGDGKATLSAQPNEGHSSINASVVFQDMTLIITSRIVNGSDDCCAGVLFLTKSYDDKYGVVYSKKAKISVIRWAGGRALSAVPWRDCSDLKSGIGKPNVIKIVLRGKQVTININGKDIVSFKGQVPEGGGGVGIYAEGGEKEKSVCEFSNFKVTK